MKKYIKNELNEPAMFGILVSVIVFLGGFGVMLIMYKYWLCTDAHIYPGLKGLFDYKASLWGDSFCLPLIIGAGMTFIAHFRKEIVSKRKYMIPIICGCLGGLLGVIIQAKWIISDKTNLNWSIPVQHHFNYAGWYHAIFFVIICFLISYVLSYMVLIDKSLKSSNNTEILEITPSHYYYVFCQFIIWLFGLLFLHFHFLDDYLSILSGWKIICLTSFWGTLIIVGTKFVIYRTWNIHYYSPIAFAVVISTLFSLISIQGSPRCDVILLIAGILCTPLYIYNSENKAKMVGYFIIFALFEYLCQAIISEHYYGMHEIKRAVLLSLFCVFTACVISAIDYHVFERNNIYDNKGYNRELFAAFCINMFLILLSNHSILSYLQKQFLARLGDNATHGLGSTIVFLFIADYIRSTFDRIKRMEYNQTVSARKVDVAKYSQYMIYGMTYFAGIVLLWNFIAPDFKANNVHFDVIFLLLFLVVLAICSLLLFFSKKRIVTIYLLIASYSVMVMFLLLTSTSLSDVTLGGLHWIKIPLIIYVSCGLSVFMITSMLYNIDLIRQRNVECEVVESAIIVGIIGCVCYGLAAYQLLIFQTVIHVLQLFLVGILAFCLLPCLQAAKLNSGGNVGFLKNYARSGVMQDGFLFGIISTANIIISVALLELILKLTSYRSVHYNIGSCIVFLIIFMLSYGTGLFTMWNFCLENNIEHCRKMKEEFEAQHKIKSKEEQKVLENQFYNLKSWLELQNIYAIALSLPYSFCFVFVNIYYKKNMLVVEITDTQE